MVLRGQPEEGRAIAIEGVELGRRVGHQAGEILAQRGVILAAGLLGATAAESIAMAEEDLRRMQLVDSPWVAQSHAWIGMLRALAGDVEGGRHHTGLAIALEPPSAWSGAAAAFAFLIEAYAGDAAACPRCSTSTYRWCCDRAMSRRRASRSPD